MGMQHGETGQKNSSGARVLVKVVDWTERKEGGQRSTRVDKVER